MTTPEFVVVGHVVRDLMPAGSRVGGTATFAAAQAHRLGLQCGIVTRIGPDTSPRTSIAAALPGVATAGRPADVTTSFENSYEGPHRRPRVPTQAPAIEAEDVPEDWREASIALIGPVCGEVQGVDAGLFPDSLTAVAAQGWLRRLDRDGIVRKQSWTGAPFWIGCRTLFVSEEDMENVEDQLAGWTDDVPIVVLTKERRGARVHEDGRWREIAAFPAREVEPTGAGDVFAAAFLVRYRETNDTAESARFASAAAACSVEGRGIEAVADRAQIEQRMARHPEVTLR